MADIGCRRGREMGRWAIGYVAMGRGDWATARLELEGSLAIGESSESIEMILPPSWGLAEVDLGSGSAAAAVARCVAALERATTIGERLLFVPFVVTGVRAYQAAGRPGEASTWLQRCAEHLERVASVAGPALHHGAGLVALAEGSTGVARTHLEAAVHGWDGKRRIWESTWARLDLASCLIRSNRFADAVPLAAESRTVASRLDSRPLADRADELMRMARGRVATEEPWRPLTSREFAVARLIAQGLTNAEIADALGIAPKTASSPCRAHPRQARGVAPHRDRDVGEPRRAGSGRRNRLAALIGQVVVDAERRPGSTGRDGTITRNPADPDADRGPGLRSRPVRRSTGGRAQMTATETPTTDRAHQAAKRYIYAWGDGTADGDSSMRDLLGGKGAGLAEMTKAGLPDAARLHDHDRGLQRLLRGRGAASRRACGRTSSRRSRKSSGAPARASAIRPTRSS